MATPSRVTFKDQVSERPASAPKSRPSSADQRALHRQTYSSELVHSTAVLLQGTTFAVRGGELYEEIQELHSGQFPKDMPQISQILGREGRDYLAALSVEETQTLITQANQYAHKILGSFREQMLARHGNLYEAFRELAGEDAAAGARANLSPEDLVDDLEEDEFPTELARRSERTTTFASHESFSGLVASGGESKATAIFQLLTGSMVQYASLPLHTFVMQLTGSHIGTLLRYRQLSIARYKDLRKMFDTQGTISLEPFTREYLEMVKVREGVATKAEIEEEARSLFEACDSSLDGTIDFEEIMTTLANVAPSASVEEFRIRLLMHWGSWKNAFSKLEKGDGSNIHPADMLRIGSTLDINPHDAMRLFNLIDVDGSGDIEWDEFSKRLVEAGYFCLQELTLRIWMGKAPAADLGHLIDKIDQALAKTGGGGDRAMQLETFAQTVFGITISATAVWEWSNKQKLQGGKSKAFRISGRRTRVDRLDSVMTVSGSAKPKAHGHVTDQLKLPATPPLVDNEVLAIYETLKGKHGHVSMNVVRAELLSGQISDVLALSWNSFAPGEMATVKYRIPRDLESHLLDKPFVAAVPAEMCWSSGGGGAWFIGRQQIFDVPGPKALLPNKKEGTLQMCIPPMGGHGEIFEFRIFSSADGHKIGRQVGAAVYFEMSAPPPTQVHICKGDLKPTSVKLMWEPPTEIFGDGSAGDLGGYVVHAQPLFGSFDERVGDGDGPNIERVLGWSHMDQKLTHFCGHQVEDLVPGMAYRFHVNAVHKRGMETLEGSSSNSVTVTMPRSLPPSAPGAPQLAARAVHGEVHLKWTAPEEDGLDSVYKYVLYWDQEPTDKGDGPNSPMQRGSTIEEDAQGIVTRLKRGGSEFYKFPNDIYTCVVKDESDPDDPGEVECRFRVPRDSWSHCRFCCAAINAAGEGPIGPTSDRLEIVDSLGKELFDALDTDSGGATDLLNQALRYHGGLDEMLSAMGAAGLLPAGDCGNAEEEIRQLGIKKDMASKLDEAGGVEAVLDAMNGLDMSHLTENLSLLKIMQQHDASPEEWEELLAMIKEAGGVKALLSSLRGLDIKQIVAAKDALKATGLFNKNQPLNNASRLLSVFAAGGGVNVFAKAMDDNNVSAEDVQKHMKSLAVISKHSDIDPEDWCRVMENIIAAGGPQSVEALLQYLQGTGNSLLSAAAGVDPILLVEAVDLLKAAGLLDSRESLELLRRLVQIPGGPQQLLKALEQIHPQCLAKGLKVLIAANLDTPRCLEAELGGLSEMDCWHKLATCTVKDWAGIRAVLAYLESGGAEGLGQKKGDMRKMTKRIDSFLQVVDNCGGMELVSDFISDITVRGGIKKFHSVLGDFNVSQITNVLQTLKRYGFDSPEGLDKLNAILQMVSAAGGPDEFLKALEGIEMSNLKQLIDFAKETQTLTKVEHHEQHGMPMDRVMEKCLSVMERVLSECDVEHFLEMLKEVNIKQLLALVPHLLNAGFLSRRDRFGNVSPASGSAEALLRWILSAGGVDQVIFAVSRVLGKNFVKCMEVIRSAELGAAQSKQLIEDFISWLRGIKGEGGLEKFLAATGGLNMTGLVQLVQSLAGNGRLQKRPADPREQTTLDEKATAAYFKLCEMSEFIVNVGGLDYFMQLLDRLDAANFTRMVELMEKAELAKIEGTDAYVSKQFKQWMDVITLAAQEGGPRELLSKCQDLDLDNFNQCIQLLRAAGILHRRWHSSVPKPKEEDEDSLTVRIERWSQVVKLIKTNGGPEYFLQNFAGVDVEDLLTCVGELRTAGLVAAVEGPSVSDSEDPEESEEKSQKAELWKQGKRMKNEQLREFTKKVKDSGGFDTFWWALKRIPLSELAQDLHCCDVMKRKLCAHARNEDFAWELLRDKQRFDDLFSQLTDAQRGSKEELSYKERAVLAERLKVVGGCEHFLRLYNGLDLQMAAEHERVLKRNHVPSTDVLSKLVGLWPLLKQDPMHLDGALGVVYTLVRWIEKYSDKDPSRMWSWLNQQIAWLLTAISENNVMLQSMNLAQSSGDTAELTPAKLAQFLQILRPIGGVQGFLQAFKGLDIATAATQARCLYDVNVRDLNTTRLLTSIYQLLGANLMHLKGLEHFVKHFGKTFVAKAQDMLGDMERWEHLTNGLVAVARNPGHVSPDGLELPATSSGTQRVLDILSLGWGLEEAGGPNAEPTDWDALRSYLAINGLHGVLAQMRNEVRPAAATWTLPKPREPVKQSCGSCGSLLTANYRIARTRARPVSASKTSSTPDLLAYAHAGNVSGSAHKLADKSVAHTFAEKSKHCSVFRPISATSGSRPKSGKLNCSGYMAGSPVRLAPVK